MIQTANLAGISSNYLCLVSGMLERTRSRARTQEAAESQTTPWGRRACSIMGKITLETREAAAAMAMVRPECQ